MNSKVKKVVETISKEFEKGLDSEDKLAEVVNELKVVIEASRWLHRVPIVVGGEERAIYVNSDDALKKVKKELEKMGAKPSRHLKGVMKVPDRVADWKVQALARDYSGVMGK